MRAVDRQKNIAQAKDWLCNVPEDLSGKPICMGKNTVIADFYFIFLQADIEGLVLHSPVSFSSLK